MHPRVAAAIALTVALVCVGLVPVSARAHAQPSPEAHPSGGDMTVRLEPDGTAAVQLSIRWRVVRGPLRFVDIANVDPAAAVEPVVAIASDDGRTLTGHLSRRDTAGGKSVRIDLDDPRAALRGTFTFDVRWRIHLVETGGLWRDGSTWRLVLSQPTAAEGFDGSKTVLDLPSAPEAPKPILPDTGLVDDGAIATLTRGTDRDVLELVRAHVARGESVTWTVRVDGHALSPRAGLPHGSPGPSSPAPRPDPIRGLAVAVLVAVVGGIFAVLLWRKALTISARSEAVEARPQSLVPIPLAARLVAGGCALALAVGCEIADRTAAGGVLAAGAVLLAAWRAAPSRKTARGPGRWLAVRPGDAFTLRPSPGGDWLDVGTAQGRMVAALAAAAVAVVAIASRRVGPQAPWLVVMDAAWLVPLWLTGRVSSDGAMSRTVVRWLARAHANLRRCAGIRVTPWARVTQDGTIDELRLLVLPRMAMPGFAGIELGLACRRGPGGTVGMPEILVRVLDSSAACAGLATWAPSGRLLVGRRPDERVLRLVPGTPGCRASTALVREIAGVLTDRRVGGAAARPPGAERRVAGTAAPGAEGTAAAGFGLC